MTARFARPWRSRHGREYISDDCARRRGTISIRDGCYEGGYLGTSAPEKVCAQQASAFFWDSVHPTSFTHCWLAYAVERDLARAGLLREEPDIDAHRDYGEARQKPG